MNAIFKGEGLTLGETPSACTPRQVNNLAKSDILGQRDFADYLFEIAF
jgi:hypothetical protein